MGLKYAANGYQFFDCERCGQEWSRVAIKGQPPKTCPECRGAKVEVRNVEVKVEVPEAPKPIKPRRRKGQHKNFHILEAYGKARTPVLLVGPAGSGKTFAARQLAEILALPFDTQSCSPDMTSVDFSGFVRPNGEYQATALYTRFKEGGVYLLDEVDAGSPSALVYANAILAAEVGDTVTFPNGESVTRHPDFVPVAGGNTWGQGATREYSGRNKLDAATLNRFGRLEWDYDEALEREIAGEDMADWCDYVQRVRRAARSAKADMLVTPRNTVNGAKVLRAGLDRKTVEETQIWNGVPDDTRRSVMAHM